jgi:predicted flavoprotein YhiN
MEKEKKGELVVTRTGLEGSAVYALSPEIRQQLNENKTATIFIDLKPAFTLPDVQQKLSAKGNKSYTKLLQDELKLSNVQLSLLKTILTKEEFTDMNQLACKIKKLPLIITGMGPIDEAISTVGGIALNEVDNTFQLVKMPNHYVIGEMLDWDAPTGGYLLQACFSMGFYLGKNLNEKNQ